MLFMEPIRNFYGRFERPISSLSLVAGFVFDALTLRRVDTLWENIWVLGHLVIVAVFIILIHLREFEPGSEQNPGKAHFWFVNILQFFFGGILSTFLVFYFRSTDIFATWPFLAILALAFIANESLKRHYVRLSFQISLLFLSIYSFSIFILPVLLHRIGDWIFLLSGLVSLMLITLFLLLLFFFIKDKWQGSRGLIITLILGIFALVNLLYFTNLIPPIPLSLKEAGVFHSVERNGDGNYGVSGEKHSWTDYFKLYPDFAEISGAPIYVFSAIFSPTGFNINIVHEWQHFDESQKKWITESVINLSVIGGRDGGFRTYSVRSNLEAGHWRVNIKTEQNKIIGSVRFNIVPSGSLPELTNLVK